MDSRAFEGAVGFNSGDMLSGDSGALGRAPIQPRRREIAAEAQGGNW